MKKLVFLCLFCTLMACGSSASDATTYMPFTITASSGTSRPSYNTGTGFFVVNDQGNYTCSSTHPCKLYDSKGNHFVPYGVNAYHSDSAFFGFQDAKNTGSNTVRVGVIMGTNEFPDAASMITFLTTNEINNSIVLMPMIGGNTYGNSTTGDKTGSYVTGSSLMNNVKEWGDQASNWGGVEKHALINIANEWGQCPALGPDTNSDDPAYQNWRDAYEAAISCMRGTTVTGSCTAVSPAYKATLVIDAPCSGQYLMAIAQHGQELLNWDPQHNLLFSFHMYSDVAQTVARTTADMTVLDNTGLPYVVGEYGLAGADGAVINYTDDVQLCVTHGVGCLAWALDDSSTWSMTVTNNGKYVVPSDANTRGNWIINDATYGLHTISTPATDFP